MKQTIAQLKEDIKAAKTRQDEANKDVKRIERDMSEFSNNKDSKLAELQSSLDKLKKALNKNSASIKPLQTEMREAMVESEQCGSDLAAAQEQLEEVQTTLQSQQAEMDELLAEQSRVQVGFLSMMFLSILTLLGRTRLSCSPSEGRCHFASVVAALGNALLDWD